MEMMSSLSIKDISMCMVWWLNGVASYCRGMEDEIHSESSDVPSLGEGEPNPWCDLPGEKIFFNP
jgi:hypothetical protein